MNRRPSAYAYVVELLRAGKQADAEDMLERAIVKFPPEVRLLFARGVLARSRWSKFDARIYFTAVQALEESGPFAEAAGACIELDKEKNILQELAVLRRLKTAHPDNLFFHWLFAVQCREQRKDLKEAVRTYETILEQWRPGPVMVHHTYANILTESLNRAEDALPHRETAVRQAERSWTCQGLANTLNTLGRHAEAEPWFAKAAEMDPDDYRHQYQWGACLADLERYCEAEAALREARRLNSEKEYIRRALLDCLVERGEYEEVYAACRKMLIIDPDDAAALRRLAVLYRDGLGVELDEERADFYQAKADRVPEKLPAGSPPPPGIDDFDRKSAKGQACIASGYRDGKYGAEKDYVKAAEHYKLAIEMGGHDYGYQLGRLYLNGGDNLPQNVSAAAEWFAWVLDSDRAAKWKADAADALLDIQLGRYGKEFVDAPSAVDRARERYEERSVGSRGFDYAEALALNGQFAEAAELMADAAAAAEANGHIRGLDEKKALLAKYKKAELQEIKAAGKTDDPAGLSEKVYRPSDLVLLEPTQAMKRPACVMSAKPGSTAARKIMPRSRGAELTVQAQRYAYGKEAERDNLKALELYKEVYELRDGAEGNAALSIGNIYAWGGHGVAWNAELAAAWYDKALKAGNNRAYAQLIQLYLRVRSGEFRDADKALEYAYLLHEAEPEDASCLRWAAAAYAQAGLFEKAVSVQEKAIRLYGARDSVNEKYFQSLQSSLEKYRNGERPYPDFTDAD